MRHTTLRTALAGCGKVGRIHAEILATLPTSDLVAVCDQDLDRARGFSSQYGVPAFSDIAEMVRHASVQAVDVCTPHPQHALAAIAAMEAGAHVLVEKPMAATLSDCDAMAKTAETAGVRLGVMSQRRLYPPVQRMRKAIDQGKIGRPVLGTVTILGWRDEAYYRSDPWRGKWRQEGGGVLVNQAPHLLDMLQWFMGPISEIYGAWANLNHPYIEVEDTAVAVIRFKGGGLGSIVASNSQNPGMYARVHIHGENGLSVGVQTDGGSMFVAGVPGNIDPPYNDLWTIPGEGQRLESWQAEDAAFFGVIDPTSYFHRLQVQDFIEAVINGREPMITAREGRTTVEMFTAIYISSQSKRPVPLPLLSDVPCQQE